MAETDIVWLLTSTTIQTVSIESWWL